MRETIAGAGVVPARAAYAWGIGERRATAARCGRPWWPRASPSSPPTSSPLRTQGRQRSLRCPRRRWRHAGMGAQATRGAATEQMGGDPSAPPRLSPPRRYHVRSGLAHCRCSCRMVASAPCSSLGGYAALGHRGQRALCMASAHTVRSSSTRCARRFPGYSRGRGFQAVVVEGDWPDAQRAHRYIAGRS